MAHLYQQCPALCEVSRPAHRMDCSLWGVQGGWWCIGGRLASARGLILHWPWCVAGGNNVLVPRCLLAIARWRVCQGVHVELFLGTRDCTPFIRPLAHAASHGCIAWVWWYIHLPWFHSILFGADLSYLRSSCLGPCLGRDVRVCMWLLGHLSISFDGVVAGALLQLRPACGRYCGCVRCIQKGIKSLSCLGMIQGSYRDILLPGPLYWGWGRESVLTVK